MTLEANDFRFPNVVAFDDLVDGEVDFDLIKTTLFVGAAVICSKILYRMGLQDVLGTSVDEDTLAVCALIGSVGWCMLQKSRQDRLPKVKRLRPDRPKVLAVQKSKQFKVPRSKSYDGIAQALAQNGDMVIVDQIRERIISDAEIVKVFQ